MKQLVLKVNPLDNVIVALQSLEKGTSIYFENNTYLIKEDIAAKHKFYMNDMPKDSEVIMYGVLVGKVTQEVSAGTLMTTQNLYHAAEPFTFKPYKYDWQPANASAFKERTFLGYHRNNGSVGTANYWLFIPTVFCENRNLDVIKEALHNELGYTDTPKYKAYTKSLVDAFKEGQNININEPINLSSAYLKKERVFSNIDGIKFLNHQGGCGGTKQDASVLSKLLASYANHPNVAGITVLSLGCQHLQSNDLKNDIHLHNAKFNKPLYIFEQQESISESDLIAKAIRQTFVGLMEANKQSRQPASLDKLTIGVKCGGSDGFSGISANPAVGYCADLLIALGGKVLLAEFPELCGVEQELINRTIDADAAKKFIHLMQTYNNTALSIGSGFHMNPSPGNIKDGLITDAIKSAGAAKKGGNAPVVDVLDYTEPATKPGLSLVCTPGNDVEATTGQTASGATLILFTTGLGTPTGNPICPTIKVSSNTALSKKMSDIIDIDTGSIIEGEKTIEQMGTEILEYCIQAASGIVIPKAVLLNQDDFIPWKRGISL